MFTMKTKTKGKWNVSITPCRWISRTKETKMRRNQDKKRRVQKERVYCQATTRRTETPYTQTTLSLFPNRVYNSSEDDFILPSLLSRIAPFNRKVDCTPNFAPCEHKSTLEIKKRRERTHTPNSPLTFHKSSTKLKNADLPPAVFLILSIAAACSLGPGIAAPFGNPAFGHPVSRL